jgi:two-component system cell cycle sensor histidine kinase/response regulator CckA
MEEPKRAKAEAVDELRRPMPHFAEAEWQGLERSHLEGQVTLAETLKGRLRAEDLLRNISIRFSRVCTREIDAEITNALRSLGEFAFADSAHLLLFRLGGTDPERHYRWIEDSLSQPLDDVLPVPPFDWLRERLASTDEILIVATTDLPSQATTEKRTWKKLKAKSVLAIPLSLGGGLSGYVALFSRRNGEEWEEANILALRLIAGIFANAINRKTIEATEEALRESESKFRGLSEQPMTGIYVLQDNIFRYVNSQFAEVFGYHENEIVGKMGPGALASRDDRAAVLENIDKRISGEVDSMHYEFQGMRKDGRPVSVEVYGSRTAYRGKPAIIGTLLDVSDRRKLETQLIQSEKMKAIGTLAGGIAHNFNNILMAIQGYASLMLHPLEPNHPHYSKLKGIEELVSSGSDLTRQLLAFASGGAYEIRSVDLNEIVRKTSNMFARTRREITIQARYDSETPVVDVDSGQIEQMLLNLYVNAWQAMSGGGALTLKTETVILDRKFVRPFSVKPGRFAKISVGDTGIGMDEKTKERIFEPFFTTKKRGMGTGLGLASVYNIVVGHGGIIQVESEVGRGATFHIYLPLSKRTLEKVEPVSPAILKGRETILLVDDEATVITVSRDMLEALGYSVLVAASGKEACQVYEENQGLIDLVILDVIMPDMGGEETFARLTAINPSVSVILSSGYSLDGLATRIIEKGCKAFIQKPFTINVLSQKLREVLGAVE